MNKALLDAVFDTSKSDRSLQVRIGPSEIGGCARQVWHRLRGDESINSTFGMAAFMGTAIHEKIEGRIRELNVNGRYLVEVEVEHDGILGHVDLYDTVKHEVIDWKTITLKKSPYFPSDQQWTQVQLYGWLLRENGYEVERVTLVGLPRDGSERDVRVVTREFDERMALDGVAWLRAVEGAVVPPEPERPARVFCQNYCQFWSPSGVKGCPGKQ